MEELDEIDARDLINQLIRRKMTIADIPTYVLCDELERRTGVDVIDVDPYANVTIVVYDGKKIAINGPAGIYVVTD